MVRKVKDELLGPKFAIIEKDRGDCPFVVMKEDDVGMFRPVAQFKDEETANRFIEEHSK